jgi:glycolate oxidase FAD binding subunit
MNNAATLIEQWCEQVREAARTGQRLRLRGGGSKDFWGAASAQTLELSTCALTGITSYEPSELVITARAGTPLQELEAELARHGQCLAFEPPHFGPRATLGGAVACGLSGPARASVGALRDYVLGVQCINGSGQLLSFGGQVMKNVAGYDVSRLLAGSWGTLGLMTEVSLKVLPVAAGQATLGCTGLGQQQALDLLNGWGGQPLPLHASSWVPTPGPGQLMVRLSGAVAAVQAAIGRLSQDAERAGGQAALISPDSAQSFWQDCREQTLAFFTAPDDQACLWRLSVPQTAPALDWPTPTLIEWHGGQRWLWAPAAKGPVLHQLARQAGGHATLFRASRRGGDSDKAGGVSSPMGAAVQNITRELQKQFDPAGVFQTGRLGL